MNIRKPWGVLLCLLALTASAQSVKEARAVIRRFTGKNVPLELSLSLDKQEGCDRFETEVKKGKLYVRGSSPVALCRGFYDYVKSHGYGICSWSGNRADIPQTLQDQSPRTVVSPFRDHYYFNVVTYGYTMPYWDWARWEKELDWMALHGVDMPLALVAQEAISARVWKKLGLTDEEISNYFVGPAHLPWMRMGNISGIDGPLPKEWHESQIALQHRILKRMRSLGMKPICPGFAGFVPQAMKRLYPGLKLVETNWCGDTFHNWMVLPDQPLFHELGRMFIEEWEKEFGRNTYYIIDSFNEMDIPFPPKGSPERYTLLAAYGDEVYRALKAGNPDAVWVMQGWMFGFQRNIWDYETLQALVSKVPDDKMMLLDLAADYNFCFWHNGANWDLYKGYYGKDWVYSVIPNMGGKTGLTGDMEFYANGRLKALQSPNRGKLTGYGMAPEGIENNEILYELICDGGWTSDSIPVDGWLDTYTKCRYGISHTVMQKYWDGLRNSVYGTFTDHPRYNWQFRPGRVQRGSIHANDAFYEAVEELKNMAPTGKDSPLFKVDFIEMTAQYVGGKMELLVQAIERAYLTDDKKTAHELETQFIALATDVDRLLCSHPILKLERWLDYAVRQGDTPELKSYYEHNAKRIVTVWGPPVDDYSARIWSGLIRDYYLPRWKHYFHAKQTGKSFDFAAWEKDWVENSNGLSTVRPFSDPIAECIRVLNQAQPISRALLEAGKENELEIGTWSAEDVQNDWTELTWVVPVDRVSQMKGLYFQYVRGRNKLMIKNVSLVMDGVTVSCDEHYGETGINNKNNYYKLSAPQHAMGNNACLIRATVKSDGNNDSYGSVVLFGSGMK